METKVNRVVTIFGSRNCSEGDWEYDQARALGRALAERGFTVCNGGYTGIMEASARGAREANGLAIGITVKTFGGSGNSYLSEERPAENLFERLQQLIALGDAYIVFRGGIGTLSELLLAWNLIQTQQIRPRPIVLYGTFWNYLIDEFQNHLEISDEDYDRLTMVSSVEEVLALLEKAGLESGLKQR